MTRCESVELVANRGFIVFVISLKFDPNNFNPMWTS